ncbi:hypothetical protein DPEC_G00119620 [Dallia pectoralis]|uniref:Uncharacterized protein n=1 Tax=Dallia pectoralis TaxID=75939 RepID=A0ACC2GQA7_DALPE|nr:hypothetical protein DPEC_G00119620 [Dallia pectoralis]
MNDEYSAVDSSPSLSREDALPRIHGFHSDPSAYQGAKNTEEFRELPITEHQERLNMIGFETHSGVGYLNPKPVNKKKLGPTSRHQYKGHFPQVNGSSYESGPTSLSGILQAALSSINRHIERKIYFSQQLGVLINPFSVSQDWSAKELHSTTQARFGGMK